MTDLLPTSISVQLARRMITRETSLMGDDESRNVALALQRTCRQVSDTLRDSLGDDGYNALLVRALARTEAHHPVLTLVRRLDDAGIHLDGVVVAVEAKGPAEVKAAIEALLGALMDVLGRLIGEDMAIRLLEGGSRAGNGGPPPTP